MAGPRDLVVVIAAVTAPLAVVPAGSPGGRASSTSPWGDACSIVVGPLCASLDTVADDLAAQPGAIDGVIGIFHSSANARSPSPVDFLSHPTSAEALSEGCRTHLTRRRGAFVDIVEDIAKRGGDAVEPR